MYNPYPFNQVKICSKKLFVNGSESLVPSHFIAMNDDLEGLEEERLESVDGTVDNTVEGEEVVDNIVEIAKPGTPGQVGVVDGVQGEAVRGLEVKADVEGEAANNGNETMIVNGVAMMGSQVVMHTLVPNTG